jgi:tetratricopeptide (TPR) repeat protein
MLLAACLALAAFAASAESPEIRAFGAASKLFHDFFFEQAETRFEEFLAEYPNSDLRAEAILYRAWARFFQGDHTGGIQLLNQNLPQAGNIADKYHFPLAEIFFERGDFIQAAAAYAELIRNHPDSAFRIEAFYTKALAYSKLGKWSRVIELLREPGGEFQRANENLPNNSFVIRGQILLGEAYLMLGQLAEGQAALQTLADRTLSPEASWRRFYLLSRIQLALGEPATAFQTSTHLLPLAVGTGQRPFFAESIWLQGEILQNLQRPDEAIQVYEKNLAQDLPAGVRRQALLKITEVMLAEDRIDHAIERLEAFSRNAGDEALDLARLTLGELHLKQYFAQAGDSPAPAGATHLLTQALSHLDSVIADFPESALLGKAQLQRGWCLWALDRMSDAQAAFEQAAGRLPLSEEQAVACFKLADTHFRQRDYGLAIQNYRRVVQEYTELPRVKEALLDRALYQILRASVEINDREMAEATLAQILDEFPDSLFGDRSLLLLGQYFNRRDQPAEARAYFSDFAARYPESRLLPVAEIAIARTFTQQQNWAAAIRQYDRWVERFAGHELFPQAEFSRALAYERAGMETNAFNIITGFLDRFPEHPLVPLARNWKGDYYLNREDFLNAQKNYQLLYQNPAAPGELAYQARLMAGRAAYAARQFKDARDYFSVLVNQETAAPPRLAAQAWFALGDAIFAQLKEDAPSISKETREDMLREAITAFNRVTNSLPAQAWGRIGDCHLHSESYDDAMHAYGNVLNLDDAPVSARSQAQVGIGLVHERLGQSNRALAQYQKLLYEIDGANFDPYWVREAALHAARLCETRGEWQQAISVYRRLAEILPALRPAIERRIAGAKQQTSSATR